MEYRVFDDAVLVRLDKGDEITTCLLDVARAQGITLGTVEGIGAVDVLRVGVFDLQTNVYKEFVHEGNCEINCLAGSITTKGGAPYQHLHITCTDLTGRVLGGHLLAATVSLTAEIFLRPIRGEVDRAFDAALGINRLVLA